MPVSANPLEVGPEDDNPTDVSQPPVNEGNSLLVIADDGPSARLLYCRALASEAAKHIVALGATLVLYADSTPVVVCAKHSAAWDGTLTTSVLRITEYFIYFLSGVIISAE